MRSCACARAHVRALVNACMRACMRAGVHAGVRAGVHACACACALVCLAVRACLLLFFVCNVYICVFLCLCLCCACVSAYFCVSPTHSAHTLCLSLSLFLCSGKLWTILVFPVIRWLDDWQLYSLAQELDCVVTFIKTRIMKVHMECGTNIEFYR